MGETPGHVSVTHLLSLGSSIAPETRQPWGSLWRDGKSLSQGRGGTKFSPTVSTSSRASALSQGSALTPHPSPSPIPVTHHRTWGSSLACSSRLALLTLKI